MLDRADRFTMHYLARMFQGQGILILLILSLMAGVVRGAQSTEDIEARIDAIWRQVEQMQALKTTNG